jgi:uncharacterized protein
MLSIEQVKKWYEQTDAVHDFDHVLRVYHTAMKLAEMEGADKEIVAAAALLHDVKGAAPGTEERKGHHIASAEFAGTALAEEGWQPERIKAVQHCIRSHRYRGDGNKPQTLEAKIIFDADKMDVIGAIGTARTIAYAVLANQPVYAEPSELFCLSGEHEPGEPHSAYHEYLFKLIHIREKLFTPSARAMAQQRHEALVAYFEQLAAEMRYER